MYFHKQVSNKRMCSRYDWKHNRVIKYYLWLICCIEQWSRDGFVKLRTAFSRDQSYKIYVQDLIRADADELWSLISSSAGGHVYVCGDARHMAHDVHKALLDVLDGRVPSDTSPAEYLDMMEKNGRYQKDVWIA